MTLAHEWQRYPPPTKALGGTPQACVKGSHGPMQPPKISGEAPRPPLVKAILVPAAAHQGTPEPRPAKLRPPCKRDPPTLSGTLNRDRADPIEGQRFFFPSIIT